MTNELRIGNWVKWKEYILPIKSIDYESVYVELNEELRILYKTKYLYLPITEIEPVPLTEERLLKFGFKKKDGEWYLYPCFDVQIIAYNDKSYNGIMFYTRTIHIDYVPIYASNHIEYAHQLQNLYFALKGEELTYGGNK